MKSLRFLTLAFLLLPTWLFAQVPEQFRFQGVARDNGQILSGSAIDVRITIFDNAISTYQEVHAVSTDAFGQFSIDIGDGAPLSGSFAGVAWGSSPITYEVEIDAGSGYVLVGNDAFVTVPYALVAKTATDMSLSDLDDVSLTGLVAGRILRWNGSSWAPDDDQFVDGDSDPTNELQSIALSGSTLSLSNGGGSVTLPTIGGGSYTAGSGIDLTGNVITNTGDLSATNELQSIALSGSVLSLSNGGGSVTLPTIGGGSYTAGSGIDLTGNVITNTGDLNANDDIVTSSIAGGDVSGTFDNLTVDAIQGRPVSTAVPSTGDALKWNGSEWETAPDLINDADADPSNELQTLILNGNVLSITNGNSLTLPVASYQAGAGISISGSLITNIGDTNAGDDITIGYPSGGDLSGPFPFPQVVGLRGNGISVTPPQVNQVLKFSNGQWGPSADLINDADADPLNEIQVLSQPSPNTIQLSKNGGTVTIPSYTPGPGITINGFQITNTGDLDGTDDVLIGSAAGGDLGGTYPNPTIGALQGIPIASFTPSVGQVLKYSSGQWMPSTDLVDDADADPSNELQALSQSGNQLALSNGGGVVTLFQAGTGISVAGNTITNSAPSPWLEAADTLRYLGGAVRLQTAGGATRTVLGIDAANNGYVNVYDNTNTLKAGFRITAGLGEVFGDAKNFRMTHPTDETKEIWYASLEGPEAAAYVRGTAHLVNGHCVVNFPEHFQLVASPQSMTVMLTPLSGESKGLAVIRKTAEGFEVTELSSGDGNYEFDWEVKCIRQGFEDYQVIREKIRD